jgi:hypothetical protein
MIGYKIPELTSFADVEKEMRKFLDTPHPVKGPVGETETFYQRWQRLERLLGVPHSLHHSTRDKLELAMGQHNDAITLMAMEVKPMLKDFERQAMYLASMDSSFVGLKVTEARAKAKGLTHRHTRWVEMAEGTLEAAKEGLRGLQSINTNAREDKQNE